MKALITGGAGFIGSHLTASLLEQGWEVLVLDDLSAGRQIPPAQRERSRFHFIEGRCQDEALLRDAVRGSQVIFHLAAIVGVKRVLASPLKTLVDNHAMTECLFDSALRQGTPVFLASSSEVYGKSRDLPLSEDGDLVLGAPTRGRWAYAAAKIASEHLAIGMCREHGLKVVIGRIFNTTGPGQQSTSGMVVPTFVHQALSEKPLTIIGDGRQSRCFTHVSDVVRALTGLMAQPDLYGEIFNIGSDQPTSINALAQKVLEATGSTSRLQHLDQRSMGRNFEEIEHRRPDAGKIERAIGWTAILEIDDIIRETIAFQTGERV